LPSSTEILVRLVIGSRGSELLAESAGAQAIKAVVAIINQRMPTQRRQGAKEEGGENLDRRSTAENPTESEIKLIKKSSVLLLLLFHFFFAALRLCVS
jgi:hypothetical protein